MKTYNILVTHTIKDLYKVQADSIQEAIEDFTPNYVCDSLDYSYEITGCWED